MSIVNRLLSMMGSKLEIKSVYGQGSEFSFKVDQSIIDPTPIGDFEKKVKEKGDDGPDEVRLYAPDARILVVDDNKMNLIVIRNLLKLSGIIPEMVLSGAEALNKMRDNTYDVVMLDHMMPEMDGIETLVKARADGLIHDGCVVIALTANAVVGARELYLREGFDDYLSKPVEVKALEELLLRILPKEKIGKGEKDV